MNRSFLYVAIIVLGIAGYAVLGQGMFSNSGSETSELGDIGGNFTLTDQNGNQVDTNNFANKYRLVYFGFTNCPDTCPAGLQTITEAMEKLNVAADEVQPMFITVDPSRDSPEKMKEFLANYDSRIIGLTGSTEQVQEVADMFKVFYQKTENQTASNETAAPQANENVEQVALTSETPAQEAAPAPAGEVAPEAVASSETSAPAEQAAPVEAAPVEQQAANENYQINHTSFFYLLNKDGKLVKHFASNVSAEELAKEIQASM